MFSTYLSEISSGYVLMKATRMMGMSSSTSMGKFDSDTVEYLATRLGTKTESQISAISKGSRPTSTSLHVEVEYEVRTC